jgi:uncharacterized protein YfaS (alpha-2-macroglobulin family)
MVAYGGLEISTSSTALQSLVDSFLYLHQYEYACTEQLASRIMGCIALRDVLLAFKAKDIPSKSDINARITEDLKTISERQLPSGGFGW